MLAQPVRRFFRRTAGQDVDNFASLQIHHHGSVTLSLPPAPIVDAQHTNVVDPAGRAPLQLPQEGVVARWHAEAVYQPLAWLAAGAMRK
jgi:hypothetical protein